ncbi:MAG: cyclodeaminase/cyclohydrolase family protein [Syntrophobacteraceae bacterium]
MQEDTFLEALRRPQPDPGGGSAAAHGALLGLAILEKILYLERGRHASDLEAHRSWNAALLQLETLNGIFLELRERDVRAYHGLAGEIAKRERDLQSLAAALDEAIACPFEIMRRALAALDLANQAGTGCRRHLVADVQVACELIGAALFGALHIASANVPLIGDETHRNGWIESLSQWKARGEQRLSEVKRALELRHATGR